VIDISSIPNCKFLVWKTKIQFLFETFINEIYSHDMKWYPILTSIDINGSLLVFQWFLGTLYSIMVFQPTDPGIGFQKGQKFHAKM
jgi:hypothetical protein